MLCKIRFLAHCDTKVYHYVLYFFFFFSLVFIGRYDINGYNVLDFLVMIFRGGGLIIL